MNQQHEYPCTECGSNAFLAYTASEAEHWDGKVEIGERLCTLCFRNRMGFDMFSQRVQELEEKQQLWLEHKEEPCKPTQPKA